jgi:hypothetical protein
MMRISVINFTAIKDEDVQEVIRVINRQIREDFEPYWGFGGLLRLEGKSTFRPRMQNPPDMRGDAVLYLWDDINEDGALGYHEANFRGIPYGFVFTVLSMQLGESWSVTLSHEALELIADPEVNLLVAGPHPEYPNRQVFHWFEMCDAIQTDTYEIDGVEVSNFVLPLYFTKNEEFGSRNDFMGRLPALQSFGVAPGGYIGFFNPMIGDHETYEADRVARVRARIKEQAGLARRSVRYRQLGTRAGALERWRTGANAGRINYGVLARRLGPVRAAAWLRNRW